MDEFDTLQTGEVAEGEDTGFAIPAATIETPAEAPAEPAAADPYASVAVADTEPESITKWKAEFEARIAAKGAETEKAQVALADQAAKEMADWQAAYEKKLADKQKANQEAQDEFVAIRDSTKPGSEWEKVAILVDFKAKTASDTSRMKSILIQLKQHGLVKAN